MLLRLTGRRTVTADCETVWAALHDVTCLKLCVPGCASLKRMSETQFDISVLVPFGPVSVALSGTLHAMDREAPRSLRLVGRGQGGLAGLATGSALISLSDIPDGCHLSYVIEAEPFGPIAGAGTLLLRGLAQMLVDRFADTFTALVAQKGDVRAAASFRPVRRPV